MTNEPPYDEREWYRNAATGQRGYLVDDDGLKMIRLDRGPSINIVEPYNPSRWIVETEPQASAHPAQLAHVLYQADKALCAAIGHYEGKARDRRLGWDGLTPEQKMQWWTKPPGGRKIRNRLWAYIKKGLEVIAKDA